MGETPPPPRQRRGAIDRRLLVGRYCLHPDWVDGPSRDGSDLAERKRTTQFVYAEQNGRYFPPVAWADPDRDPSVPRPWTYHYFTRPVEEVNRAFAEAGAVWYLTRIAAAFREGGTPRRPSMPGPSPTPSRTGSRPSTSGTATARSGRRSRTRSRRRGCRPPMRAATGTRKTVPCSGGSTVPDEGRPRGIRARALGTTVEEAAEVFTRRLFASREFAKQVYTRRDGFLARASRRRLAESERRSRHRPRPLRGRDGKREAGRRRPPHGLATRRRGAVDRARRGGSVSGCGVAGLTSPPPASPRGGSGSGGNRRGGRRSLRPPPRGGVAHLVDGDGLAGVAGDGHGAGSSRRVNPARIDSPSRWKRYRWMPSVSDRVAA